MPPPPSRKKIRSPTCSRRVADVAHGVRTARPRYAAARCPAGEDVRVSPEQSNGVRARGAVDVRRPEVLGRLGDDALAERDDDRLGDLDDDAGAAGPVRRSRRTASSSGWSSVGLDQHVDRAVLVRDDRRDRYPAGRGDPEQLDPHAAYTCLASRGPTRPWRSGRRAGRSRTTARVSRWDARAATRRRRETSHTGDGQQRQGKRNARRAGDSRGMPSTKRSFRDACGVSCRVRARKGDPATHCGFTPRTCWLQARWVGDRGSPAAVRSRSSGVSGRGTALGGFGRCVSRRGCPAHRGLSAGWPEGSAQLEIQHARAGAGLRHGLQQPGLVVRVLVVDVGDPPLLEYEAPSRRQPHRDDGAAAFTDVDREPPRRCLLTRGARTGSSGQPDRDQASSTRQAISRVRTRTRICLLLDRGGRGRRGGEVGAATGAAAGAVMAKPAPGANVVTFGGIALSSSIAAHAGHCW